MFLGIFLERKTRGWLTILGILIGITAVVALISVSQGMQAAISDQFAKMGSNKLIIMAGSADSGIGFMSAFTAAKKLTIDDLEVVQRSKGVDLAAQMLTKSVKMEFNNQVKYTFLIGMPTDETMKLITDMAGFEAEFGRDLKDGDKYKVSVGYELGQKYFDKPIKVGNTLAIQDVDFKVIGVVKKIGNPQDDEQVYVPIETAREILGEETEVTMIYVQIKPGFTPEEVAEYVKKDLRNFRDEKKDEETFSVQTFEQLLSQVTSILGIVGMVLIVISAISLVVGGVGIMNSMYTSVLERTREIGVMKAIGARNSHILTIFLIESGLYGLIGGIAGVLLGLGIAKIAEIYAMNAGFEFFKASFSPALIFGALAFSFIVGCVSGYAPARSAANMKPVDALRYE